VNDLTHRLIDVNRGKSIILYIKTVINDFTSVSD
jgi:hypothetical protein